MSGGLWWYRQMGLENGPVEAHDLVQLLLTGALDWDTEVRSSENEAWTNASSVRGLPEGVEKARQKQDSDEKRARNMVISTGPPAPQFSYTIIDTIFAIDSDGEANLLHGIDGDPNVAFERVKSRLKARAYEIGADCVINCQFEYRIISTPGLMGTGQGVELFAYGTAVKWAQ